MFDVVSNLSALGVYRPQGSAAQYLSVVDTFTGTEKLRLPGFPARGLADISKRGTRLLVYDTSRPVSQCLRFFDLTKAEAHRHEEKRVMSAAPLLELGETMSGPPPPLAACFLCNHDTAFGCLMLSTGTLMLLESKKVRHRIKAPGRL